jgi:uncharacterized protein YjgD (DUF1641 family)
MEAQLNELKKSFDEYKSEIDLKINIIKESLCKVLKNQTELIQYVGKLEKKEIVKKRSRFDEDDHEIIRNIKPKVSKEVSKEIIIKRLIRGKTMSLKWSKGMSKYVSITYCTSIKKWQYNSSIFNESRWFNTKLEVETFAEDICKKYDIPLEYITRKEYDKEKDIDQNDNEFNEEEVIDETEIYNK